MPFIVPGVARYAINAVLEDRPCVNIFDIRIDTTGSIVDRADAIDNIAGILINEWGDSQLPFMINDYVFNSVSWVDLDSLTGSVGSRTSSSGHTLPEAGGSVSDGLPANTAVLVTKQASTNRSTRNGRCYWAALTEGQSEPTNGNVLTAAAVTSFQDAWDDFYGNVNQEDASPLDYTAHLCVVHILSRDEDGNPLTGNSTDIQAFSVQSRLATQRRRLRG